MKTLRAWFLRLSALLGREKRDREFAEEIESHIQLHTEDNIRSGMSPERARREALLKFGAVESAKESYREQGGLPILETFAQDLRFGARMLRRNPGFTFTAVLILGLGIGANSAIFSVVNAVLLKPLPYENGDHLVVMRQQGNLAGLNDVPFSVPEINDFRSQNHSLSGLVEYHNMAFILLGRQEPERVVTGVVSWNFFDVFGVKPLLGRNFRSDDEQPGAPAVLLLSYEYWIRSFGGDPTVVNRTFTMNDRIHTVIGVLPPLPQYPDENDVYMPTTACPFRSDPQLIADRRNRMMQVFGVVKPGINFRQAQADLSNVAANLERAYPTDYPAKFGYAVQSTSLPEELTHNARPTMLVLLGAAGFVLLIACANVANLNLARMTRRERELAVRAALGAGRARIFRQLLTESMIVAFAGGALGLVLAHSGLDLLTAFVSHVSPRSREIRIDNTVLLFTFGIAVLTSIVSGTISALDAGSSRDLREGRKPVTTTLGRSRLRSSLIVSQVAVSFLLLIGAGLMLRSFIKLQHVDPGFQPENVLTMKIDLNFSKYDNNDKQRQFYESLLQKIEAQPGVRSAAASMIFPLGESMPMQNVFMIEGQAPHETSVPVGDFRVVSAGYFKTLQVPVLEGREFTIADRPGAPEVAIVSHTSARRFWGNQEALGKRISTDNGKTWIQVVGVVGDVKQNGLDQDASDEIYFSFAQAPLLNANLVIKTSVEPMSIARSIIELIYQIDPNQPAARIRSLEQVRSESIAVPRLTLSLLGLFALIALAIAAVGIGGVMALNVSQRTHEIGVRMAIGAWPHEILRMVLGQGMLLTCFGLVLGMAGALSLTHILHGLLFEIEPTDPPTFVAVAGVLALAAATASYFPARRAARVEPMTALRCE
jgi:predicted permease